VELLNIGPDFFGFFIDVLILIVFLQAVLEILVLIVVV
jgi:hypothetical protein